MNGQMKSKTYNCPCNNTCACHVLTKNMWKPILTIVLFAGILILAAMFAPRAEYPHIEVNGHDCVIDRKIDQCNSTGACRSHNVAVCP